ncbi:zinc finger protein 429-like isoform X2 [Schistocerca gregaria]|uniref:zinc finger protein 429-like isoform X2 n=1 Tax=Schistocerca gregaria TaxID=7010 RepID=UPI00211F2E4B|nr:zinc finger protein 429-like isoform X2 [Schistocerca gregaria]
MDDMCEVIHSNSQMTSEYDAEYICPVCCTGKMEMVVNINQHINSDFLVQINSPVTDSVEVTVLKQTNEEENVPSPLNLRNTGSCRENKTLEERQNGIDLLYCGTHNNDYASKRSDNYRLSRKYPNDTISNGRTNYGSFVRPTKVQNRRKVSQHLTCNICGKYFATRPGLYLHRRKHKEGYQFECDTCSRKFMDKQTLKEHLLTHMIVKPYLCQTCGKHFSRHSRLKKHLMKHSLETVRPKHYFTCSFCEEVFISEEIALKHAKIGHGNVTELHFSHGLIDRVFLLCRSTFPTFSRLQTHKIAHSSENVTDSFEVPSYYACTACDKSYLHWTNLTVHWKLQHDKIKYMYHCKFCSLTFPTSWTLSNHCKHDHADMGLKAYKRTFKCKICFQLFKNASDIRTHMDHSHNSYEETKYLCETCGKVFKQKASLEPHIRSHQGLSQHKCKLCGKTFVHQSSLSSHLRLHRGDKRHTCKFCDKAFFQLGDRINHERKHTGERPFKCDVCGRAFRTRGMWFEHSRIHKDERPFPCDICGAAFRRSYALKNHKTVHTGEKKYVCSQCNHAFRVKQDMQKHINSYHRNEITFTEAIM